MMAERDALSKGNTRSSIYRRSCPRRRRDPERSVWNSSQTPAYDPRFVRRHPSRGTRWGRDGDATTRAGSDHKYDDEYEADGYGIRALIRLPPMTTTNVTGEGGRVPGGARPGPPPVCKQQRLPPSYVDVPPTSPRARVVSVTS